MPFDVQTTMPDRPYAQEFLRAIKSVNLMSFLLEDVTYNQLYVEDFSAAIGRILDQAKKLNDPANDKLLNIGAYDNNYKIQPLLVAALIDLQDYARGNSVLLGEIFYKKLAAGSPQEKIVARLNKLHTDSFVNNRTDCELDHFCCPFNYFQEAGIGLLPQEYLSEFLSGWGNKRTIDLYTTKRKDYTEELIGLIRNARNRKILKDQSTRVPPKTMAPSATAESETDDLAVMVNPWANGLICENGVCVDGNPEDWCNDAGGSCSAASSP